MCTHNEQRNLEIITQEYWRREGDLEYYISRLLPRELHCAKNLETDDGLPRLYGVGPGKKVHTLVMMVGESLEPLLQLVCVLQPKRIELILNNSYADETGWDKKETLQDMIEKLSETTALEEFQPELSREDVYGEPLAYDTPTAVFQKMQKVLSSPESQPSSQPDSELEYVNVVDITGAKKSMVVGAFLYAAHSGIPITYVDFDSDKYDRNRGRPFGYGCKIREIANPYQAFALRDWERIRQLYQRYDFRGARELLTDPDKGILKVMQGHLVDQAVGSPLYNEQDIERAHKLINILEMYESWDSGNFCGAWEKRSVITDDKLPDAIVKLGWDWFQVTAKGIVAGPKDFYADSELLRIYAIDELHRLERLIDYNQDYRSAFLRSGGLNEVIMTARVVATIESQQLRAKFLSALQKKSPNGRRLFLELMKQPGENLRLDKLGLKGNWPEYPQIKTKMSDWWQKTNYFASWNGWEDFLTLRNTLAHRYVSVPESLARDGLQFVRANFEDFFEEKISETQVKAIIVPWTQLCELLQLNFLPPKLRH